MPASGDSDKTLPEIALVGNSEPAQHLRLTILYHPRLERIGQVGDLSALHRGQVVALSRSQLEFGSVRGGELTPLADDFLSRQALQLEPVAGGRELILRPGGSSVRCNGQWLQRPLQLSATQLEAGVVLLIARRLVLFLHWVQTDLAAQPELNLVGEADAIQRLREQVLRLAPRTAPVLLMGASGTGKELLAQALHDHSERAQRPLVAVNMAAIPSELAASELFGSRRGAFTGAANDRAGYFQRAAGGSLFLDEIGACPASVQALLLRALQEGEIQPAGAGIERVDVRVIAATDAAIDGENSRFSVALRHRLGGFELYVPRLAERREDLGRLLVHFLPPQCWRSQDPAALSYWAGLVAELALYHWPGNVRELSNFATQLAAAAGSAQALSVPDNIRRALAGPEAAVESPGAPGRRSLSEFDDEEVAQALARARWEISQAARELAVSRQALYRRIEATPGLRVAAEIPVAEVEAVYAESGGELEIAAGRLQVSESGLRRRWRALDLVPQDF